MLLAIRNKRLNRELNRQIQMFSEQFYNFDDVDEAEMTSDAYLERAYSKDSAYLLAAKSNSKYIRNTLLNKITRQLVMLYSYRTAYLNRRKIQKSKQEFIKSLFLYLEETKFKNRHQVFPAASKLINKDVFDNFIYFKDNGLDSYSFHYTNRNSYNTPDYNEKCSSYVNFIKNKPWLWGRVLKNTDFESDQEQVGYLLASEMFRSFIIPEHIESGVLKSGYIGYKTNISNDDGDFFIHFIFRIGFLVIENVLNNYGSIQYRKRLEGLEKNYKDAAHILREIKHDMNTSLSTIQSLAHRMVEQDDIQDRRYLFERINYSGIHLSSFLLQRMDLDNIAQKSASKRASTETSNVKIINLIKEASLCFSEKARSKNINFLVALNDKVPDVIETHPDYIIQVIYNLLNNAFKYTDSGLVILSVTHKLENNGIEISVSDTGVGIPKESLENIFDKYYRASNVSEKGAGIGLSICKMNIEALGGTITVSSEVGYGSQFIINIPATNAYCLADTLDEPFQPHLDDEGPDFNISSQNDFDKMLISLESNTVQEIEQMVFAFTDSALSNAFVKWIKENVKASLQIIIVNNYRPSSTSLNNYRFMLRYRPVMVLPVCIDDISILIIDDMPEIINFWSRELLTKFGYKVDTATSYSEAMEKLTAHTYDLILSDFNLDDGNTGLDILQKIRHDDNTTPFIFLTADDNYAKINACIASGAHKVLRKPLQIETLSIEIKNLLEKFGYHFKDSYINTLRNNRRKKGQYRSKNNIDWPMINSQKSLLVKVVSNIDLNARANELIRELQDSFNQEDVEAYIKSLHKIKNMASSFYMSELKAHLEEIREHINSFQKEGGEELRNLRKEHDDVISILRMSINIILTELKRGA
jgi:signal transduction histidine kinase/CheY-like chemotaxis protein